MSVVTIVGVVAIASVTLVMIAAIAAASRANFHKTRSGVLENLVRDVLVSSLTDGEVVAYEDRRRLLNDYEAALTAPFIDGGY